MPIYKDRATILEFFTERGILLSPGALDMILDRNLGGLIKSMISDEVLDAGYISERELKKILNDSTKDRSRDFEIYIPDVVRNSSAEDFRGYFVSRYEKLRKIISTSASMRGTSDIKSAKKSQGGEIKIVGMISSVSTTRNGHKRLTVEDLQDHIDVIIMKGRKAFEEILLEDEVVGIVGSISNGKGDRVMFANEIIRPDIPFRVIEEKENDPVYIASLSDIHVGSKTFRKDEFKRMISWIKSSSEDSKQLKYLVLSGDVVDGIGVYPGQENDLELLNPVDQYGMLAELISDIPSDVQVFLMPGNHDVVRLPEPQPMFSDKIASMFPDNTVMLPNPYTLHVENKSVMIYHGMSLNDMVELIPGANFDTIGKAVEELLRRRHLAPKYGGKTPLVPSMEDRHVIEEVPDVFITGHVHSHAIGNYRGVRYVNSSTWQSQTEYQKMMNFSPNPSMLTLFDLNSRSILIRDFKSR